MASSGCWWHIRELFHAPIAYAEGFLDCLNLVRCKEERPLTSAMVQHSDKPAPCLLYRRSSPITPGATREKRGRAYNDVSSIAALADAAGKQMVTTIQPRPFAQDAV